LAAGLGRTGQVAVGEIPETAGVVLGRVAVVEPRNTQNTRKRPRGFWFAWLAWFAVQLGWFFTHFPRRASVAGWFSPAPAVLVQKPAFLRISLIFVFLEIVSRHRDVAGRHRSAVSRHRSDLARGLSIVARLLDRAQR